MRLVLVRHGQSEGNARGILQGHMDFSLTALGREQAEATARYLAGGRKVERLLSSPLARAMETAEPIAAALGLEVEPEPALAEYDMGEASGLTWAEIRERFPAIVEAFREGRRPSFPGEEGRDEFHARVSAVVRRLEESDGGTVAIAHGGVVSAICSMVLGLPAERRGVFETANCSIAEVVRDRSGRKVLLRQNDVCHLSGIVTRLDVG